MPNKKRGSKKPIQHNTLTFVNEEMTYQEVIEVFQSFGDIRYVNKYMNRYFVQFESPSQARMAQSELGRIYRVAFAHAKTNPRPKKNFRPLGELVRLAHPANLPRCGYTGSRSTFNGRAMIEEYVNSSAWKNASSASTRSEMAGSNEGLGAHDRELGNPRGTSKSSKNQSQGTAKQNQLEKPANPKRNASKVQDPEYDDSDDSDDNMEGPKAQKRLNEEGEAEEDESEEEEEDDDQDQDEEDDQQAEARALGAGTRRRVRIEGLDEIMQELGSDMAYSVIVANIPERYTLDEVYDLVEEVKPIAFSEMDYSIKMRVKFCEVFLNDAADVDYLKQKLNDFVICGKQLTVMEPAEILDETRWNA